MTTKKSGSCGEASVCVFIELSTLDTQVTAESLNMYWGAGQVHRGIIFIWLSKNLKLISLRVLVNHPPILWRMRKLKPLRDRDKLKKPNLGVHSSPALARALPSMHRDLEWVLERYKTCMHNSRILAKEHLVAWGQVSHRLLGPGSSSGPLDPGGDRNLHRREERCQPRQMDLLLEAHSAHLQCTSAFYGGQMCPW